MRVLTPLVIEYVDGKSWVLRKTFAVDFDGALGLRRIYVPRGFVTDFNSIPRFFWRLAPPTEYGEAAVIHDYLYRIGAKPEVSQEIADKAHRELMKWKGASKFRRGMYYGGLRAASKLPLNAYHRKPV